MGLALDEPNERDRRVDVHGLDVLVAPEDRGWLRDDWVVRIGYDDKRSKLTLRCRPTPGQTGARPATDPASDART